MTTREQLKRLVCEEIDRHAERITAIGDAIMADPELGYREFKTAARVARTMAEFDITPETGLGLTGVKGMLDGTGPGPTVAIMGELDALQVKGHPDANPETNAAHGCGHNAQIAGMLGAMIGLKAAAAAAHLAGRVAFMAVPAEEAVEIGYRLSLVEAGKIGLMGGKPEMLRLGYFDDVDMAMIIHTHSEEYLKKAAVLASCNGCLIKMVRFIGRATHAGSAPDQGINALNAAQLALAAIHAQRETFRDEDSVRVHPIITKGGDAVNVVPAEVFLETFVRAKTNAAMLDAEAKVDRACRAGAMAVGASVEIRTVPGYLPLDNDPRLTEMFRRNAEALFGADGYVEAGHDAGSTDAGDLSQVMPVLHPSMGGATGPYHSADWRLTDKNLAYIGPAKALALMAVDLLWQDAGSAREVLAAFKAPMTKAEYLALQQHLFRTELFDGQTT
jgi:amidohydrolase